MKHKIKYFHNFDVLLNHNLFIL